jgi:hypothetical protein
VALGRTVTFASRSAPTVLVATSLGEPPIVVRQNWITPARSETDSVALSVRLWPATTVVRDALRPNAGRGSVGAATV